MTQITGRLERGLVEPQSRWLQCTTSKRLNEVDANHMLPGKNYLSQKQLRKKIEIQQIDSGA